MRAMIDGLAGTLDRLFDYVAVRSRFLGVKTWANWHWPALSNGELVQGADVFARCP